MTIIYFIIALGVLVLVHEWGHFIMARRAGIRVEKFSIGFGPKLFSIKGRETEYRISLLPLGGYVKLFGEDPIAEAEGDSARAEAISASPDSFSSKPLKSRLATVFAGPAMNLVFAVVLMPVVFMVGRMIPAILEKPPVVLGVKESSPAELSGFMEGDAILKIDAKPVSSWADVLNWVMIHPDTSAVFTIDRKGENLNLMLSTINSPFTKQEVGYAGFEPQFFWGDDPVVGGVTPGSPADKAGLAEGDVITSVSGRAVRFWTEMTEIIRGSPGNETGISYRRKNENISVVVRPQYNKEAGAWIIGITKYVNPDNFVRKRYGFFPAIGEGMKETWRLFVLTSDVLGRLFTFRLSYKALGGPLQIAEATGAAARSGAGEFLYFLAFLSMQLGILNLLPIPVLDGGHVLFMAIEGMRRRPVSLKWRNALTQAGLAFLLGLMLVVTFNDFDRIWGFGNLWEKIRGIFW